MPIQSFMSSVYPKLAHFMEACRFLPLSGRSLVIKACQAQQWPTNEDDTLYKLFTAHPDFVYCLGDQLKSIRFYDLPDLLPDDITFSHPIESAILLDIMRALPLPIYEIDQAKIASWNKEIGLAEGCCRPKNIRWSMFFDQSDPSTPISDDLPANPNMLKSIRRILWSFRESCEGRTLWPRATHKNMSRSTRREYEDYFNDDLSDVPIFGQDDWERTYEATGVKVGGASEMRQKWYPAQAKPRTYFAMGGEAYSDCRFLQDFFSDLVNAFSPTNHIYRLRPSRLVVDPKDGTVRFFIYDLSSFTSNMGEQRYFMEQLSSFFAGTEVLVCDERNGPIAKDLGDLLDQYNETCVFGPQVSYERFDESRQDSVPHGVASLLGIFGNLMTCTIAHFFIMSSIIPNFRSANVAGDDGITPEDILNNYQTHSAINHVGEYAREKCFRGEEDTAICLKRPFNQHLPTCSLDDNFIPPGLAVTYSYLFPRDVDPRYHFFDLDSIPLSRRVSTIGKDLTRFLERCWAAGIDEDEVAPIWHGFSNSLHRYANVLLPISGSAHPIWPPCPSATNGCSPLQYLLLYTNLIDGPMFLHQESEEDESVLRFEGESARLNSSKRLSLLERLGFVVREDVPVDVVDVYARYDYWRRRLLNIRDEPQLFSYVVVRQIPDHWFPIIQ
jgi:hypothetical protein